MAPGMKIWFALGLALTAQAAVTNVSVGSVTAQQAKIFYTAPDNNACTLAVYDSASNLIPDVNPSLFSGSNLDSRAGNTTNGRVREFVVGQRGQAGVAISGANTYSRSLAASSTYTGQITCNDGSTAPVGSFSTLPIAAGAGWVDPVPSSTDGSGTYLFPTLSTTSRTAYTVDPHTGVLVKNLTLPGDLSGGGAAGSMGTSGMWPMTHPATVNDFQGTAGFHSILTVAGYPALYWIAPSTGETRFLGFLQLAYSSSHWNGVPCNQPGFHPTDPNQFYCVTAMNEAFLGSTTIVKITYTGHTTGNDADMTGVAKGIDTANATITDMMPHSPINRTLEVLEPEFDPTWSTTGLCCNQYLESVQWFHDPASSATESKAAILYWSTGQNYPAWLFIYDPNQTAAMQTARFGSAAGCINNSAVTGSDYTGTAGCITASTPTAFGAAGTGFRYTAFHSFDVGIDDPWLAMTLNPIGQSGYYYQVTIPAGVPGSASTCTLAQPGGNTLPNWPGSSYAAGCSLIVVSSDATLTPSHANWPSVFAAAPGDLLTHTSWTGGAYILTEVMRLVDKGSDGLHWTAQRIWTGQGSAFGGTSYTAVSAGGTLDLLGSTVGGETWWNPVTGVTGMDPLPETHAAHVGAIAGSSCCAGQRWNVVSGYTAQSGSEPTRLTDTTTYPLLAMVDLSFNGFSNYQGSGTTQTNLSESHPSVSVSNPPSAAAFGQVIDARPYLGGYTSSLVPSGTTGTISLVSGQLYRITGLPVRSEYKLISHHANSGNYAVREVSGPSSSLSTTSSSAYQWCVALFAGECYSGSTAGDVYFNAPSVAHQYCNNNWSVLQSGNSVSNDICIDRGQPSINTIQMQSLANDPKGSTVRTLIAGLTPYDTMSNYWNARTLPDGSWAYGEFDAGTPSSYSGELRLFKIPAAPDSDSVDRTHYVPFQVSVPPNAANNVIVQFGYAENGAPTNYYCMPRQEACEVAASTIQTTPFYFASETFSGASCTSGCTITVPAISGRTLYWQILGRNSNGTTANTGAAFSRQIP